MKAARNGREPLGLRSRQVFDMKSNAQVSSNRPAFVKPCEITMRSRAAS
jgi:hypothetical protein